MSGAGCDTRRREGAGLPDVEAKEPILILRDLGVFFRLQRTKRPLLKDVLLRRVSGAANKLWALRHVDLVAHEGQALGIIGPNGAGKTTLCRVISQIIAPDEGEAHVRGRVSALVTLGTGFNRDLSGRANIRLYGSYLGFSRQALDRLMDEIVAFSELGEFVDQPVRYYSSGMRARLGFSVAAALDPEILLLDEVLSVGDRAFRAKSQARIREMMQTSRLIVVVSHSSDFLRSVCTHALWLEKGRVRAHGEAEPILDAYDRAMGGADPGLEPDA